MKILVVDDHVLIRQAMHGVLRKLKRDAVVLEAATAEKAMQVAENTPDLDLVLLDLTLPDRDGFSVLADMRSRYPAVSVVVLSAVQDSANVMRALGFGAIGYIPKSSPGDVILNALRLVMSGGTYIPPEILVAPQSQQDNRVTETETQMPSGYLGLTDRQLDVLALMMQGSSNKTICRTLNLAEPTVKNHVTAILKVLNVTNRTEAVIAASNLGWKLRGGTKS